MSSNRATRRLTTILAADVVGYSRLIGTDDEEAVRRLRAYRDILENLIARHDGRIEGTAGDGLIAEFPSAVEAVRCAIEIQGEIEARNETLPADRQIRYRIGISIGDVIVDDDELHGDGVNIASRLEGLAEPGGICLSGGAHEQVRNKVPVSFEHLGPRTVKNIAQPVDTYRAVLHDAPAAAMAVEEAGARRRMRLYSLSGLATVLAIGIAVYGWYEYLGPRPAAAKPTIAVLPFTNMSDDPGQEYFSDGLTEDLITNLAQYQNLAVIARHSVFTFKGKSLPVKEISRGLGVRYVLEGSVRKADNAVRITAQLTDSDSGEHLWAARYDRPMQDIFKLQDEITQTIAGNLLHKVSSQPLLRTAKSDCSTDNLDAYLVYSAARSHFNRLNPEDNRAAVQLLDKALTIDPGFAAAHALRSDALVRSTLFGWPTPEGMSMRGIGAEAKWSADKAIEHGTECGRAYRARARVQSRDPRQLEAAEKNAREAIARDPSDPEAHAVLGRVQMYQGNFEEAVRRFETAIRFDPLYVGYHSLAGVASFFGGQYDAAEKFLLAGLNNPNASRTVITRANLAAVYYKQGHKEKASELAKEVRRMAPWFDPRRISESFGTPFSDKSAVNDLVRTYDAIGLSKGAQVTPAR